MFARIGIGSAAVIATAVVVCVTACRTREDIDAAPPAVAVDKELSFAANTALELVYVDLSAKERHAVGVEAVPKASRQVVRVMKPTVPALEQMDDQVVYVVDLNEPGDDGRYHAVKMQRRMFRLLATVALPPGQYSRVAVAVIDAEGKPFPPHNNVILYGTSWCGACRQALEFFAAKRVPVIVRNVEREPGAAVELAAKAAYLGVQPDRVPFIDVRGTLLVGFDEARLTTLLGDQL